MIGLLFVAASVGSGFFSDKTRGALRMFLTASVVHFGCTLAICLIVLAPLPRWEHLGGCIGVLGVFGLIYSALAWRDTVRTGLSNQIDWEDRFWYAVAPAIAYTIETVAGIGLGLHHPLGCALLAAAAGGLLLIGIHNAWDMTLWSVTHTREE